MLALNLSQILALAIFIAMFVTIIIGKIHRYIPALIGAAGIFIFVFVINMQSPELGAKVMNLGQIGQKSHKFGEGAHAHHILHVQQGGTNALSNCVVLCEACHYSAHEGGNYQSKAVRANRSDYPYYNG